MLYCACTSLNGLSVPFLLFFHLILIYRQFASSNVEAVFSKFSFMSFLAWLTEVFFSSFIIASFYVVVKSNLSFYCVDSSLFSYHYLFNFFIDKLF